MRQYSECLWEEWDSFLRRGEEDSFWIEPETLLSECGDVTSLPVPQEKFHTCYDLFINEQGTGWGSRMIYGDANSPIEQLR